MPVLIGNCTQGVFGRAGFRMNFPGLLTCVQLPPLLFEGWS